MNNFVMTVISKVRTLIKFVKIILSLAFIHFFYIYIPKIRKCYRILRYKKKCLINYQFNNIQLKTSKYIDIWHFGFFL